MSSIPTGRILWFETLCRDAARMRDFYAAVCEWTIVGWPMGGGGMYEMFAAGGVPVGALQPFPASAPAEHRANAHWLPYFAAADVDATAASVRRLGGTVWVEPNTIPSVGRMAVVADRTGADFALHCPDAPPPATAPAPAIGHVSWVECNVLDSAQALSDYGELFGWTAARRIEMGQMGAYQLIHHEGRDIGGFYQSANGELAPWRWMCYVRVGDLDAAFARATSLGASVVMEPHEVPTGGARIAMLRDPEGAAFGLQWNA